MGSKYEDTNKKHPPLAEFGADAARSFADHTTGRACGRGGAGGAREAEGRQRGILTQA